MNHTLCLWAFLGLLGSSTLSSAQQVNNEKSRDKKSHSHEQPALDSAMDAFVEGKEVAGLVVMVSDKQGPIVSRAYGWADVAEAQPMTADSIFWIASMTKPITGACVMMLQEQGQLSLDDPITKHLPEMQQLKLEDGTSAVITIRQLLNHTAGMAELPADQAYTAINLKEAAQRYAHVKMLFVPGSQWKYSQTGINTAARIVEVVSGLPFDKFVQQRICDPLGMVDTTFYLSQKQLARLAKSYQRNPAGELEETTIKLLAGRSPTDRNRLPAANGGLFSTARDYSQFCRMLLNDGELNGQRLLSPQSVETMRTIATGDLVTGFTPGNGWGVGCCVVRQPQGVSEALSPGSFGHGGAYGTQAWIDPSQERIYVLMTQRANFSNSDASAVRHKFQQLGSSLTR